jgi:excisionase family DNA binding protein
MDTILSVEQVAEILNLHPRTIRTYVREGRLPAVKTGKQWRIRQVDLEAFTDGASRQKMAAQPDHETDPLHPRRETESIVIRETEPQPEQKIKVSAVADVQTVSRDEALRLSNSILAVFNSDDPDRSGARCDYLYYPETGKARFLFWGRAEFVSGILKLLSHISDEQPDNTETVR